ncbi:acetate--CoA ligase family protein [Chloroflexota bacterium]
MESLPSPDPLDETALGEALVAVSPLMPDHPEIEEMDLNLLLVLREGIIEGDARTVLG